MRVTLRFLLVAAFVLTCTALVPAQGLEVAPRPPATPTATDLFTSIDGRFSIALPAQASSFGPEVSITDHRQVEGASFGWRTAHGSFEVTFIDRPQMLEEVSDQALDQVRDTVMKGQGGFKPKLVSERGISLNGHPGRDWKFEILGQIAIIRVYLVGNRSYLVKVVIPETLKSQEEAAVRILESFKLLTQEEAEAQLAMKESESMPPLLPQTPVAARPSTDAKDGALKGKVKTVFTETEDVSETGSVSERLPSSREYFNEQGNHTKTERYDYRGNLNEIRVYGYLDGERVSNYKYIRQEYDPPPMMSPRAPGAVVKKSDPRYSTKFIFKYDDKGRLKEAERYWNDGELVSRAVYNYSGNQTETLVYARNGALNQKYLYTIDQNGNRVEDIAYDVKDNSVRSKYSFKYELDSKGNWTKQIASEWKIRDGKSEFVPSWVSYRAITYYDSSVKVAIPVVIGSAAADDGSTSADTVEGEVDKMLREEREFYIGTSDPAQTSNDSSRPPIIVSGGVLNGKAVSKPAPEYPAFAKAARASGTVEVKILIGLDGRVIAAQVVSGHPFLRAAALKAAREARFSPTYLDKKPVKVAGVIFYNFVLI